jgi:4-hydroxybenzoate polyprenyltransferase
LPLLMLALSAFYVGGMFLNDAYDAAFDAQHRRDRPIPAAETTEREVFGFGYGLLALGFAGVAWAGAGRWTVLLAALGLAAAIVAYDRFHKGNPLSPLLMGLCRVGVLACSAWAVMVVPQPTVVWAAVALLGHLIGLTYIAKQEHLNRLGALWPLAFLALPLLLGVALALDQPLAWAPLLAYAAVQAFALQRLRRRLSGDVPRAVVTLIAAICLLDALLLAGVGQLLPAVLALLAFPLTLALQRWVAGT